MKAASILQNRVIVKATDFMDRVPGLISLTVMMVIVIGFIG